MFISLLGQLGLAPNLIRGSVVQVALATFTCPVVCPTSSPPLHCCLTPVSCINTLLLTPRHCPCFCLHLCACVRVCVCVCPNYQLPGVFLHAISSCLQLFFAFLSRHLSKHLKRTHNRHQAVRLSGSSSLCAFSPLGSAAWDHHFGPPHTPKAHSPLWHPRNLLRCYSQ